MKSAVIDAAGLAGLTLLGVGLYRISLTVLILFAGAVLLALAIVLAQRAGQKAGQ